ncbi:type I-D CRISPR-associated protein Cas7/Csc2 [candidate division WOR-3 bacterium]|nr:type I-D CRISPR-associated protein Cas7/Csc2 [candidate division WOR-3 bacterium]
MTNAMGFFNDIKVLPRGRYLQLVVKITLLDDAIIRSNEPEEVLTFTYKKLGTRFIIPWRKVKGKLRRMVMEKQRELNIPQDSKCYLKDNLCMKCPACLLFGGTGETSKTKSSYNLLSRVLGETFISQTEVKDISAYTANAVDEETLTTGQALMTIVKVPTETEFIGVVTLRDPTKELTAILVDNLNRLTRLGASTREWGKVKTEIIGYVLSDREMLSSYDIVQEMPADLNNIKDLQLPPVEDSFRKVADAIIKILPEGEGGQGKKKQKVTAEAEKE